MAEIETERRGKSGDVAGAARARMAVRSMDAEARAETGGISEDEFGRFFVNVVKFDCRLLVRYKLIFRWVV